MMQNWKLTSEYTSNPFGNIVFLHHRYTPTSTNEQDNNIDKVKKGKVGGGKMVVR